MDLISIIIPVYNTQKYLEECLDSVLNQTYSNLEVILINDGSTDDSDLIIKNFKNKFPNIIYIKQKNQGTSVARNNALKVAHGCYISFVDSDDIIHKDMYQILMNELKKHNADIVYSNLIRFNTRMYGYKSLPINKVNKVKICNSQKALKYYFQTVEGNVCAALFKRELFEKVIFPPHLIYEDNLPKIKVFLNAKKIVFGDYGLYFYRDRRNSNMTSKFNRNKLDIVTIGFLMETYLREKDEKNFYFYKKEFYQMITKVVYYNLKKTIEIKYIGFYIKDRNIPIKFFYKILFYGLYMEFGENVDTFLKTIISLSSNGFVK